MRHRLMIAGFVAASALCIGLVAVIQPPAPAGKFPPEFPDAERRQIVSVANRDALKQTLDALRRGRFGEARRWWLNSRKQTVRNMGQQGDGKIWITFGVDEQGASDGYAIWARYVMKQENGRWIIDKGPF